jgi:hypothetical protein
MKTTIGNSIWECKDEKRVPSTDVYVEMNDRWWFLDPEKGEVYYSFDRHELLEYKGYWKNKKETEAFGFESVYSEEGMISYLKPNPESSLKIAVFIGDDYSVMIFDLCKELVEEPNQETDDQ